MLRCRLLVYEPGFLPSGTVSECSFNQANPSLAGGGTQHSGLLSIETQEAGRGVVEIAMAEVWLHDPGPSVLQPQQMPDLVGHHMRQN